MRIKKLSAICVMAGLMAVGFGCQKETIVENGSPNGPALQGAVGDACSTPYSFGLATSSGNTDVDVCVSGNVIVPCNGPTGPWGSVTATKIDGGYPNSSLQVAVSLAPGWVCDQYFANNTPPGFMPLSGNLPQVNNNWIVATNTPALNQFVIDIPSANYGSECTELGLVLNTYRINIFGAPITATGRTLYAYDPNGAGSPFVIDHCYEGCTLPELNLSQGTCQGCRAQVDVTYHGCASVDISSCKSLRQVVIVYSDCSREYHDNLTVTSASYTAPAGKTISHVYVRSGCRSNSGNALEDQVDTNGNSYSNVRRFRFDASCVNGACN